MDFLPTTAAASTMGLVMEEVLSSADFTAAGDPVRTAFMAAVDFTEVV